MGDRAQGPAGYPRAATLITRNRPPTARTHHLAARVDTATYRAGARYDYHTGLAFRCAIERNVGIADYNNLANSRADERLTHARAQLTATSAGQTNLGYHQICPSQMRNFACLVNRLAHSRRGIRDSNPQWI
jgi:hypothetical protein